MKTSTAIIIIAIAAIIIGGGIWWWAGTSDEDTTQNGAVVTKKTPVANDNEGVNAPTEKYLNEEYGFSFSYDPGKYSITETRSKGGATGDESDLVQITKIGESCPAVDIFVSTASLDQEQEDLELRISGETVETTVAGIAATKRSGEITENIPPCGSEKTEVVFENNDNVFVITAFKDYEEALNELLESINFY